MNKKIVIVSFLFGMFLLVSYLTFSGFSINDIAECPENQTLKVINGIWQCGNDETGYNNINTTINYYTNGTLINYSCINSSNIYCNKVGDNWQYYYNGSSINGGNYSCTNSSNIICNYDGTNWQYTYNGTIANATNSTSIPDYLNVTYINRSVTYQWRVSL